MSSLKLDPKPVLVTEGEDLSHIVLETVLYMFMAV